MICHLNCVFDTARLFFLTSFLFFDFGNGELICLFRIFSVMWFLIYACFCHFLTLNDLAFDSGGALFSFPILIVFTCSFLLF